MWGSGLKIYFILFKVMFIASIKIVEATYHDFLENWKAVSSAKF